MTIFYEVHEREKKVKYVRVAIGIAIDEFNIRSLLFKFISFVIEMKGDCDLLHRISVSSMYFAWHV